MDLSTLLRRHPQLLARRKELPLPPPYAQQAALDALAAYNNISPASRPGGTDPSAGQLGGHVVPPGVYKAAGGSFQITGSDLTLDALGDINAIWVFQSRRAPLP